MTVKQLPFFQQAKSAGSSGVSAGSVFHLVSYFLVRMKSVRLNAIHRTAFLVNSYFVALGKRKMMNI